MASTKTSGVIIHKLPASSVEADIRPRKLSSPAAREGLAPMLAAGSDIKTRKSPSPREIAAPSTSETYTRPRKLSSPRENGSASSSTKKDADEPHTRVKRCKLCKYTKLETILDFEVPYCTPCIDRFFPKSQPAMSPTCLFGFGCTSESAKVRGHSVGFCMNHILLIKKYTTKHAYFFPHTIKIVERSLKTKCSYVHRENRLGYEKGQSCPAKMEIVVDGINFCHYHAMEYTAVAHLIKFVHQFFSWHISLDAAGDGSKEELGFEGPVYKGELAAKKVLEDRYRTIFIKTRELPFLRGASVGSRNLEIDLYSDILQLGVEVQGDQHYKADTNFNSNLAVQQANDTIKANLCAKNGVYLIQLPWSKDWRGMQDVLNDALDKFDELYPERLLALRLKNTKM